MTSPPCGAPCHILHRALVELATHHGTTLAVEWARMGLTPPPRPQDTPVTGEQAPALPLATPTRHDVPGGHQ